MILFDAALGKLGPYALFATTLKVYDDPFVKPLITTGDVAVVAVKHPGADTTLYEVIAPPPTQAGAVKVTVAQFTGPAVAVPIVGALATFRAL